MKIALIAALAENRVIGRQGDLPWRIPTDMKRFVRTTRGHHVIMGRKTYETINKPLKGRPTVVVTRQEDYQAPGCHVVHSLEAALELAREGGETEAMVAGGEGIYRAALPKADVMYLTWVHSDIDGDTYFPEWEPDEWEEVERDERTAKEGEPFDYAFSTYRRNQ